MASHYGTSTPQWLRCEPGFSTGTARRSAIEFQPAPVDDRSYFMLFDELGVMFYMEKVGAGGHGDALQERRFILVATPVWSMMSVSQSMESCISYTFLWRQALSKCVPWCKGHEKHETNHSRYRPAVCALHQTQTHHRQGSRRFRHGYGAWARRPSRENGSLSTSACGVRGTPDGGAQAGNVPQALRSPGLSAGL